MLIPSIVVGIAGSKPRVREKHALDRGIRVSDWRALFSELEQQQTSQQLARPTFLELPW